MDNPWKVLGIPPTRDPDTIKRTYRSRAQKLHPDKAKTPERRRKNTARFVQLQAAYEAALTSAERQSVSGRREASSSMKSATRVARREEWAKALFILVGGAVGILALLSAEVYVFATFPPSHPAPIALGALMGIAVGSFAGAFLFLFLLTFYMPVVLTLDKIGLGTYSDKFGWACSVVLWLFVVSRVGIPEMHVRETTKAVLWLTIFGFGPIFAFVVWIFDYIKYLMVRKQYISVIANNSMQRTAQSAAADAGR